MMPNSFPLLPRGPFVPFAPVVPLDAPVREPQMHPLYLKVASFVERCKGAAPAAAKRTNFTFVLDESGSMLQGRDVTIAGFNQQVDIVKEGHAEAGQCSVTLLTFSTGVRARYVNAPVSNLAPLTTATYRPDGGTALRDAAGAAIERAIDSADSTSPNTAFLIALFTDGEENSSVHVPADVVSLCVKALEQTGRFTFTLMGPKEHLQSLADMLAVTPGNISGFDASTVKGRVAAMSVMSGATSSYMAVRGAGLMSSVAMYQQEPPESDSGIAK